MTELFTRGKAVAQKKAYNAAANPKGSKSGKSTSQSGYNPRKKAASLYSSKSSKSSVTGYAGHPNHSSGSSSSSSSSSGSSASSSSSSGGSKSYSTGSGGYGGGGSSAQTTTKKETYYERTTTTQDTVETTTITYTITKQRPNESAKTTLDNGQEITNIRLYDDNPDNRFLPTTRGVGLDDLFSKCEWNTSDKKEMGEKLTTNYTEEEFKSAITNRETPTADGGNSDKTLVTKNNLSEDGSSIGRIIFNDNDFSYVFGSYNDAYVYDASTDSYVANTNQYNPSLTYKKNDDNCEVTLKYYEDIIRPETDSEWLARVKNNPAPSFAQIYKKIDDDEIINSISISTTSKFRDYMSQVWGTVDSSGNLVPLDLDKEAAKGDAKHVLTLFIDNITLHEAEHIPLFHPNVRMKFYHSNDKPDDVDTYSLRKMGAVIEYR